VTRANLRHLGALDLGLKMREHLNFRNANLNLFKILIALSECVPPNAGLQKKFIFPYHSLSGRPGNEPGPLAWHPEAVTESQKGAFTMQPTLLLGR
jgi:hypothetical protein